MSIDLEDYFCDLPYAEWSKYESRIEETTNLLLDLFDKHKVKATFFTLGYIAEKFPDLIKKIHESDHEIACHSYYHKDLRKITAEEFEKDLTKSISVLEKISGEKILGFRAPFFSIDHNNFWVFDILRKYLKYDSSVFPVKTSLYGLRGAGRIRGAFGNRSQCLLHESGCAAGDRLCRPRIATDGPASRLYGGRSAGVEGVQQDGKRDQRLRWGRAGHAGRVTLSLVPLFPLIPTRSRSGFSRRLFEPRAG